MSAMVKSEIDDEYSNSSESDGPVDLSEGTLRVFTDLEQPRPKADAKPPNQMIEVLVDGKIQIFEIQSVEAGPAEEGIISYAEAESLNYSTETGAEYINLDTGAGHGAWQSSTSLEPCSAMDPGAYYDPMTGAQSAAPARYTGPIEISYPTNVLYPPPPSEAGPDNHNILIQRAPTRGGRKEGKTGANRSNDHFNDTVIYYLFHIDFKMWRRGSSTRRRLVTESGRG